MNFRNNFFLSPLSFYAGEGTELSTHSCYSWIEW